MNLNGFLPTTSGRTKLCYVDWACLRARQGACSHPQCLASQGQSGSTNSSAEWNVPDHRAASAYCHTPWSPECPCWPQRVHRNAPGLRSGSWFLAQHYLQLLHPTFLSPHNQSGNSPEGVVTPLGHFGGVYWPPESHFSSIWTVWQQGELRCLEKGGPFLSPVSI